MTTVGLISIILLLFVALWVFLVERRYRLTGTRPSPMRVLTRDGWDLAVWHRPAANRRFLEPVILCHGLANNHGFFDFEPPHSLAAALCDAGFECYSVDLRGAGASRPPHEGPWDVSFDDHVMLDVPAVLDFVTAHAHAPRVLWVGHSLGGLVGLASLSSTLRDRATAVCTVGSPAYFLLPGHLRWLLPVARWLAPWGAFNSALVRWFAPLAGRIETDLVSASSNLGNITPHVQRLMLANVFAPMWRGVLGQLEDWARHDVFRSKQGVDYRLALANLELPSLVIGGSVDGLAPEPVTRRLHALLGPTSQLVLFGRAHGHSAEYGHGDLIIGRRAPEEVYPVIVAFLLRVATPV